MAHGLIASALILTFANVGVEYYVNEHIRVNDIVVVVLLALALALAQT